MNYLLSLLLILNSLFLEIDNNLIIQTKEIYNNLVSQMGNFPSPPDLKIISTFSNPAKISNGTIYIENGLLKVLNEGQNFESKIAYVLAHELAHHYLNHASFIGSGFTYVNNKELSKNEIDYENGENNILNKRIEKEGKADEWGGFFAQVAGYNSLDHGEAALKSIYNAYKLNNEIKGYPSLQNRIGIINSNIEKVNNLVKYFEIANISLIFNKTDLANSFYEELIKNSINSSEIYNNFGVSLLLKVINSSDNFSKYYYPLFIDNKTIMKVKTRNISKDKDIELLNEAIVKFNRAKSLNSNYKSVDVNLLITEILLNKLKGKSTKLLEKKIKKTSNLDKSKKNELFDLINEKVSRESTDIKTIELPKFETEVIEQYKMSFGGLRNYKNDIKTSNYRVSKSKIQVKEKLINDINIIEINNGNRTVFFETQNKKYLHDLNNLIGTQKFDRSIDIGIFNYKVDYDSNLALKFKNNVLVSVYKMEIMDY